MVRSCSLYGSPEVLAPSIRFVQAGTETFKDVGWIGRSGMCASWWESDDAGGEKERNEARGGVDVGGLAVLFE